MAFLFKTKPCPNRRYSPRKKTRNLVLVSFPSEQQLFNLVDLSESGAQMTSTKPIRRNKIIHLKINLAEHNKEITLKGRVIWSRMKVRRGPLYRVGVAFMEISQEAWMRLHSYLSQGSRISFPPAAA